MSPIEQGIVRLAGVSGSRKPTKGAGSKGKLYEKPRKLKIRRPRPTVIIETSRCVN